GGQTAAQLRASNYGGSLLSTNIGTTTGGVTASGWAQVTVANIAVTNGQCEIGFYSNAGANQAIYFDDVTFTVQTVAPVAANSVLNASFEDDQAPIQSPKQWTTQTWGNTPAYTSYTETYGGGHTGAYHGTHYLLASYQVYTYQVVTGLTNGTYTLSAWVKSSSGQPKVQLQANNYGKGSSAVDIPATSNGQWLQVTVPGIIVSNGQCEVGFYSQANKGGQSLYFDDVALIKQETSTATSALSAVTAAKETAAPTLYPNPAYDQVTITTSVAQATEITLVVTNLQGVTIAKYKRQAVAGSNQFTVDTSDLASGTYILQILSSETSSVQHLEVRH
ncbi:MAG: T9SS type A sorting domain-containing protein, partial [Janthinobacterium lividum]